MAPSCKNDHGPRFHSNLKMPAAMRNPMSVVKPIHTPDKPNTDVAHNRTSDDMTPTAIVA